MRLLSLLFHPLRREEPSLDVGLAGERTAMAWQRTGLALAGFSALLVHLADRDLLLATPGFVGLAAALTILVAGERRYSSTVDRAERGESVLAYRMVVALMLGVVVLAAAALAVVVAVGT